MNYYLPMACACVTPCATCIRYARTHILCDIAACECVDEGIYRMERVYGDEIGIRDTAPEVFVIDHT